MLPHEAFAFYYQKQKERWDFLFLGDMTEADDRRAFWQEWAKRKDPRLMGHPMMKKKDWKLRAVPLSVHGDAVPVVKVGKPGTRSFDTYSLQSLRSKGTSMEVLVYMFGIFDSCIAKAKEHGGVDTLDCIWRIVVWSLTALYEGKWPEKNWDGGPLTNPAHQALAGQYLAEGFFGVVVCLKGDLDYYTKNLGLRHYNANLMCDYCPARRDASDPHYLFNNVGHSC
eukprot:14841560-Alexandrium_andersonii.AAC.1